MAVSDKSIDPRILNSAREEFLEVGYDRASLKNICRNAGVTTGALYKRYAGKEDLFHAVVEPAVQSIFGMIDMYSESDLSRVSDEVLIESWTVRKEKLLIYLKIFYDNADGIILLLNHAENTKHRDFEHELVLKLSEMSVKYYEEGFRRGIFRNKISSTEIHVLYSAFIKAMVEPIIHRMSWEEIEDHADLLCKFFHWKEILDVDEYRLFQ